MKKWITLVVSGLLIGACTDSDLSEDSTTEMELVSTRMCASMDVLAVNLTTDPGLKSRMEAIEAHGEMSIRTGMVARINAQGKIEIPVVVNVLYRTSSENISDAQIQSQIDVLNEDFNKTNADAALIPSLFSGVVVHIGMSLPGYSIGYSPF